MSNSRQDFFIWGSISPFLPAPIVLEVHSVFPPPPQANSHPRGKMVALVGPGFEHGFPLASRISTSLLYTAREGIIWHSNPNPESGLDSIGLGRFHELQNAAWE